jgi:UDP-3-O-[3-hydroxymyristoyl] glucosamine N-acyltransferase
MPDPRFFESLGPIPLGELAAAIGAELAEPAAAHRLVEGVAPLAEADAQALTFFSDRRYAGALRLTSAGACVLTVDQALNLPAGCVPLVTAEPQAAWAQAAHRLHRPRSFGTTAAIDPSARVEDGVRIASGAVVGPGAEIGSGTEVGPGAVIGPGVAIGRDCVIGPNAVVTFALLGDRVRVYAGAIVGEAGFGVAGGRGGALDVPQLGRVILQDGVTIGANSCVDRGAFGDTVIGENTKLDNLVQVGHNVRLGRNCVLASHTGISGSVTVGDGVAFGGRAGIADHLTIGSGAQIAAAAGVMKDVPAGETWGGFPAKPLRQWLREASWVQRMAAGKTADRGRG